MDTEQFDQYAQHSHEFAIDGTKEVINHVLHTMAEPAPAAGLYACMDQQGQEYGEHVAASDLAAHAVGTHPDATAYNHAFNDALATCHFDDYVPHDALSVPSLSNPVAAFAEVALTPSSLNAGESQYFESQHAFDNAFVSSYQHEVHSQFDDQLASQHSIDWGHEQAPVAPTIDRALDFQTQNAFDAVTGFSAPSAAPEAAPTHSAFASAFAESSHSDSGASTSHSDGSASSGHGDSGGSGGTSGSASSGGL
jgi:uncharacterized membrane protein YgcG